MCHLQRHVLFSSWTLPIGCQELDPSKNPAYNLVVLVKDMGDQKENSFSDTTSVDIIVLENIWKEPAPVVIVENSTDPHPIKITQVCFQLFSLQINDLTIRVRSIWCYSQIYLLGIFLCSINYLENKIHKISCSKCLKLTKSKLWADLSKLDLDIYIYIYLLISSMFIAISYISI